MRYWDDKDANGNKLTDGRVCLVIKSDDDADMPEIRTYGKDKEEVLDKIAKTAETAQAQIHRMRKHPQQTPPPARTTPSASAATDVAKAVTDLTNPTTAPGAVKTLLKAAGVDVDKQAAIDAARRVADVAQAWELANPDYPKDPRNDQILINKAAVLAGGPLRITAEFLDAAFQELTRREMFFEPKGSTVPPRGSEGSRTVEATSYRRNTLRSPEGVAAPKEGTKEQKWRDILQNGTGKAVDDAIRAETSGNRDYAGFQEFANKLYAKSA